MQHLLHALHFLLSSLTIFQLVKLVPEKVYKFIIRSEKWAESFWFDLKEQFGLKHYGSLIIAFYRIRLLSLEICPEWRGRQAFPVE